MPIKAVVEKAVLGKARVQEREKEQGVKNKMTDLLFTLIMIVLIMFCASDF